MGETEDDRLPDSARAAAGREGRGGADAAKELAARKRPVHGGRI
jgi:hypothetical protein